MSSRGSNDRTAEARPGIKAKTEDCGDGSENDKSLASLSHCGYCRADRLGMSHGVHFLSGELKLNAIYLGFCDAPHQKSSCRGNR